MNNNTCKVGALQAPSYPYAFERKDGESICFDTLLKSMYAL